MSFLFSYSVCLALCNHMDCSPPGYTVRGISQARILECVAIFFSRGSSWPRDRTFVFCTGRWVLYHWATRETPLFVYCTFKKSYPIFLWSLSLLFPLWINHSSFLLTGQEKVLWQSSRKKIQSSRRLDGRDAAWPGGPHVDQSGTSVEYCVL